MPERRRRDEDDKDNPRRPRKPTAGRPVKRTGRPPEKAGKPASARTGRPVKRTGRPPEKSGKPARPVKRTGRPSEGSGRPVKRTGRPAPSGARGAAKGRPARDKRHSKESDDRNPTRSGIQYPSRKTRVRGAPPEPEPTRRSSLRKVKSAPPAPKSTRTRKAPASTTKAPRRRRPKSTEALDELARVAGRGAAKAQDQLSRAAEAFSAGRERDAARLLRPLRDAYPDVAAVRELLGLCQYRTGNFEAATKELEAFVQLTGGDVEQHPVLMDCARAKRKYRRVDELWRELADSSPTAALVTEGRIVLAGSLADRGRLQDAISALERRAKDTNRVQEYHLRAWYALADLYERAGDIPRARQLFLQVRKHEAGFADVAERLASLN